LESVEPWVVLGFPHVRPTSPDYEETG
jgi:hypothetical protein